ncbi:MAG: hypothetical protein JNJ48_00760 [Phycisphaerae bacterium]|nr:hypothetical protein [Phycisphaerae bacterium]
MTEQLTSTLNRGWLIKMVVVLVVFVGFGAWGLYDATILYPSRGRADASYKQKRYLELAQSTGRLFESGFADPHQALRTLEAREADLAKAHAKAVAIESSGGNKGELTALAPLLLDHAALQWLTAESLVGGLNPATTKPADPTRKLSELQEFWKTTPPPKSLEKYDLPLQWAFTVIGFVGGAWMMLVIARAARTRFGFDPATQTLRLPNGRTITPADVREFDKRKWDKFFLTLNLHDGSSHKLDLLRNVGLEEWCLAMEKTAFPDQVAADEAAKAPATPAAGA